MDGFGCMSRGRSIDYFWKNVISVVVEDFRFYVTQFQICVVQEEKKRFCIRSSQYHFVTLPYNSDIIYKKYKSVDRK